MGETPDRLPLPPQRRTAGGRLRGLGVELEMIGPDIATLSRLIAEQVGGTVRVRSDYEHRIEGAEYGTWRVELDFAPLKNRRRKEKDREDFLATLDEAAESLLRAGAERIMPLEVVTPPLPMNRLSLVEDLIVKLRQAGARGTRNGLAYAFAMQFNPEMPDTGARSVTCYLKAFLCLDDWLRRQARVDLTRRLTVFIDPFPRDYVRRVVDPGYWPELPELIDDYLAANPTRNRALDLLPLFLYLDPHRVREVVVDRRVKPRPALHYRLPNCEVDRADWGIEEAWRQWLQVEHLAADPDRLENLCRRYAEFLDRLFSGLFEDWALKVETWLIPADDL